MTVKTIADLLSRMRDNPSPNVEWQRSYDRLLIDDTWLKQKTGRKRRVTEQFGYLTANAPHVFEAEPGLVIDLGCGPGELLEMCRAAGHEILGVDADDSGKGGMGWKYVQLSRLLCEKQNIPTMRLGLNAWIDSLGGSLAQAHAGAGRAVLVNARGSWEQMFSNFQAGPPHDEHHDARKLRWVLDEKLTQQLGKVFRAVKTLLREDGLFLIACNGSANHLYFEVELLACADAAGFDLTSDSRMKTEKIYAFRERHI